MVNDAGITPEQLALLQAPLELPLGEGIREKLRCPSWLKSSP